MFGKNPPLPPKKSNGQTLDVQSIFSTFQGEAMFTGFPAVFIRLGGCNLNCKFCDAEFDSYKNLNLDEIILRIIQLSNNNSKRVRNLVVITGGEPMRQNINPLCKKLLEQNFLVQIETNGTLFQNLPSEVKIVCSPKNNSNFYGQIRPDLLPKISAFKFLISKNNKNYNFVPDVGQDHHNTPVYLQPMDEYNDDKNRENRTLVLEMANKLGCKISLQTHKFWEIE